MIYQHILLAVDLSDDYDYLIDKSQQIVKAFQSRFSLISVIPAEITFSNLLSLDGEKEIIESVNQTMKNILNKLSLVIEDYQLIKGNPKLDIVNYIREKQIDLVIVGNRPHHHLVKILAGSTSDSILNNSLCDVIFVTPDS
ncbi:universal stress protein [Thiotrichales bacterium 19S3-7]|nr:universal stress protein [Thiotrichales bacterium 19S3-7]MCF6801421.1 universal stress protein [Thiotrichales bacterium 19S3-11]